MPHSSPPHSDNDEDLPTPLLNQTYLSNPLHHKRITFIPAAPPISPTASHPPTSSPLISAADRYLSIVSPLTSETTVPVPTTTSQPGRNDISKPEEHPTCPICHLPLPSSSSLSPSSSSTPQTPHECLLAHQLSLPHSHPPSHLARSNKGLQYLSAYGWDPDERVGLGPSGEGIRVPVKPKAKADTSGLGVKVGKGKKEEPKKVMLDAGKVRKLEREEKKKRERLQREFSGRDEVERYLGQGG